MPEDERGQATAAINLDAETATCPACETEFNPQGADRCPDCGLRIG
jgi:hypothetical protein